MTKGITPSEAVRIEALKLAVRGKYLDGAVGMARRARIFAHFIMTGEVPEEGAK